MDPLLYLAILHHLLVFLLSDTYVTPFSVPQTSNFHPISPLTWFPKFMFHWGNKLLHLLQQIHTLTCVPAQFPRLPFWLVLPMNCIKPKYHPIFLRIKSLPLAILGSFSIWLVSLSCFLPWSGRTDFLAVLHICQAYSHLNLFVFAFSSGNLFPYTFLCLTSSSHSGFCSNGPPRRILPWLLCL